MHVYNAHKGQLGFHLPEKIKVDNFAGGGGASLGMEMGTGQPVDVAINHDTPAISMHTANHPYTKHYCEDVWAVDPLKAAMGRVVKYGWFSPDCTHFSKAKGGTPASQKIRGLAWIAPKWGSLVEMEMFTLENVEEFKGWGPLDSKGKAIKARKGETFDGFIKALTTGLKPNHPSWREAIIALGIEFKPKEKIKLFRGLGYYVEHRIIKACDFGAPTSRKRFFLSARKDGYKIKWPEPTHGAPNSPEVISGLLKPWLTAASCIDWGIPCKSIFNRKKPLAKKTMWRIARGVKKYVIEDSNRHIVSDARLSFTEKDNGDLCMAFMAQHYGGGYTGAGLSLDQPLGTVTAVDHHALVVSHLVKFRGNEFGQSIDRPMPTITAKGTHIGEVRTFLKMVADTLPAANDSDVEEAENGLIRINGQLYQVVDIAMRMLAPHELYKAQGFPDDYIFDRDANGNPLTKAQQTRMCGNSVSPLVAAAIVKANIECKEPLVEYEEVRAA